MAMRFRTCIAASVFALAAGVVAPAGAVDISVPDENNVKSPSELISGLVIGQLYKLSLTWTSVTGGAASFAEFGAQLVQNSPLTGVFYSLYGTQANGGSTEGTFIADATSYKLAYRALGVDAADSTSGYAVFGLTASVAAVPSPVAAAGLPAGLAALVGLGLYRRRQRAA